MQPVSELATMQSAPAGAMVAVNAALQQTMRPAAVLHPVSLLLSQERAQESDGLWAAKQFGDFEPGDQRKLREATVQILGSVRASKEPELTVNGSVEIRQLRNMLKIAFTGLDLVDVKLSADDDASTLTTVTGTGASITNVKAKDKAAIEQPDLYWLVKQTYKAQYVHI
jgi:hypothetical protein